MIQQSQRGFTMFYALLIASLALSIGIAIYDLTQRELALSIASTQSFYAIYAADTGAECALYWDTKGYNPGGTGVTTAFATSSTYAGAPTNSSLNCTGVDITSAAGSWSVVQNGLAATTTFSLALPSTQTSSPCVTVIVAKSGNPSATTVTSNGFNTCAAGALQLERTLQLTY